MSYGNPDPTHPVKFIKSLISPRDATYNAFHAGRMFFKLLFEFWGFCVNGTNDLTSPGGFATSGTISLPFGFMSGSGSLLAVGSDGETDFGNSIFRCNSQNFLAPPGTGSIFGTGSLYNKYLVIWKSDDPSPDDSIYRIIGVENSNQLRVRVDSAGTTRLGGKASFSARSKINYRIIDMTSTVGVQGWLQLPTLLSASMVLNFTDAPRVNKDQAISQLKLDLALTQTIVRMTVSPSGSWTSGSFFTDASTPVSQSWFAGAISGSGQFTFIGGRDFLITFLKGEDGAWNANTPVQPGLHIEIPQRLYPKENDPNPIAWTMWTNSAQGMSPTTGSYANGFKMRCQDGVTRDWITLVKAPTANGTNVNFALTPGSGGMWYGFTQPNVNYGRVHYNSFSGTYMTTDAVLMQSGSAVNQQYSMSRVRLRRVRFSARNLSPYLRLGDRWMHVGGGVLWPWDGSQVPEGLFWEGGGAQPGEVEG